MARAAHARGARRGARARPAQCDCHPASLHRRAHRLRRGTQLSQLRPAAALRGARRLQLDEQPPAQHTPDARRLPPFWSAGVGAPPSRLRRGGRRDGKHLRARPSPGRLCGGASCRRVGRDLRGARQLLGERTRLRLGGMDGDGTDDVLLAAGDRRRTTHRLDRRLGRRRAGPVRLADDGLSDHRVCGVARWGASASRASARGLGRIGGVGCRMALCAGGDFPRLGSVPAPVRARPRPVRLARAYSRGVGAGAAKLGRGSAPVGRSARLFPAGARLSGAHAPACLLAVRGRAVRHPQCHGSSTGGPPAARLQFPGPGILGGGRGRLGRSLGKALGTPRGG